MLSAADQKFLDGLMQQFLFDPKGAQYVRVKTTARDVWAASRTIQREGWLVPGQDGKTARVSFTDGESIAAPSQDQIEKIDFLEQCRKRYADAEKPAAKEEDNQAVFAQMRRTALGQVEQRDLTLAAWLYRLDQPELAAKALKKAAEATKKDAEARGLGNGEAKPEETEEVRMVGLLKDDLAWTAFAAMVHAYMVRADEEALAHGERLLRLYPEVAKRTTCRPRPLSPH